MARFEQIVQITITYKRVVVTLTSKLMIDKRALVTALIILAKIAVSHTSLRQNQKTSIVV